MIALVFIVIVGIIFAYFATLNTVLVSLNLGFYYLSSIPLYLVVLIPLAIGMIIGSFIYLAKSFSSGLTISGKEHNLKDARKEINELTKRIHQLELENTKLKAESNQEVIDDSSI